MSTFYGTWLSSWDRDDSLPTIGFQFCRYCQNQILTSKNEQRYCVGTQKEKNLNTSTHNIRKTLRRPAYRAGRLSTGLSAMGVSLNAVQTYWRWSRWSLDLRILPFRGCSDLFRWSRWSVIPQKGAFRLIYSTVSKVYPCAVELIRVPRCVFTVISVFRCVFTVISIF